MINISAPIELFFAAQFALEWNCSLLELRNGWTQNNGGGRLYNGTSPNPNWTDATAVGINLVGTCPLSNDGPTQGKANFLVDWGNYYGITRDGEGVNVTAPPGSPPYPAEGELLTVRWRTSGAACYGTTHNTGATDIRFVPTCKITGYKDGAYEYTDPVTWTNTSVTIN
jgi:hypothetical protein